VNQNKSRNDNRVRFFGAIILVAVIPPTTAWAQHPAGPATKPSQEPPTITLRLGQSEMIRAPWPVKRTNITDPKIAEAEPLTADQFLLQGKGVGSTDLVFWSAEEEVWRARVDVEMDLRRLKDQFARLFPGSNLELLQNHNVVVVSGTLRRSEDTLALHQYFEAMKINYVDATRVSGVQQVLLQVRVAEANRTALRSLGINVLQTGTQDNTFFGTSTVGAASGGNLNNIQMLPAGGALVGDEAIPVPFVTNNNPSVSPLVTLNLGFPRAELQFLLQALAENQYMRILSEPNLVAQSGEEANFLAGGEFPIPIVQGSTTGGGSSISVEYKEFGVRLKFKPIVLGDGLIRLYVNPEVSEISEVGAVEIQGFRIPAIATRRASTTLELHSGQSFSIAGLIDKKTNSRVSRVPGIGDLPVLGALFRSIRYEEGETELVVLVTASLAEPSSLASLPPLPGATHSRPNDWEVYLGGMIEGMAPPRLSDQDTEWLKKLGFEDLVGPGAWSSYGEPQPANSSELRPNSSTVSSKSIKSEATAQ
jgi:pilus assembly protein CpaC